MVIDEGGEKAGPAASIWAFLISAWASVPLEDCLRHFLNCNHLHGHGHLLKWELTLTVLRGADWPERAASAEAGGEAATEAAIEVARAGT